MCGKCGTWDLRMKVSRGYDSVFLELYLGVSLNGGTPISHPKMIIFSRKTHGFVGETQHFRKPPFDSISRELLRQYQSLKLADVKLGEALGKRRDGFDRFSCLVTPPEKAHQVGARPKRSKSHLHGSGIMGFFCSFAFLCTKDSCWNCRLALHPPHVCHGNSWNLKVSSIFAMPRTSKNMWQPQNAAGSIQKLEAQRDLEMCLRGWPPHVCQVFIQDVGLQQIMQN